MITLIGARCKHSNVLSQGVLISDPIRKFGNPPVKSFYDHGASIIFILPHEVVRNLQLKFESLN